MSKVIKQMQMEAIKSQVKDVRDMVMLSVSGLAAIPDNKIRVGLRKKGIRMMVVKNSLCKKVFDEIGLKAGEVWEGPTTLVWGGTSVADLSKEIQKAIKPHEKAFKVKTAIADGQAVPFETALKMPTKAEAIGRVVMLALAPASRLASQIVGPASQVAGQIKGIKDMKKDEAPAPPAA